MARRDTNSRITPDVAENLQIQPAANPVNKQQQFKPQVEKYQSQQQTYQNLAAFGKGVLDVDNTLRRQAGENTIAAYAKTAENNRKDWAEVSKNVEGMAKFNPYNKDAYNKLVGADIARKWSNKLYEDPDIAKRSPEEVAAMIETNQQGMLQELKAQGLQQKDYADYLITYSNRGYKLQQEQIVKNAEYEYKLLQNKYADSTAKDIATVVKSGGTIEAALINAEKSMDKDGMPSGTKADVLEQAITNYIAENPDADINKIKAVIKNHKIEGKNFSEFSPNIAVKTEQFARQIKRSNFDDMKFNFEVEEFKRKEAQEKAMIGFFNEWKANPNMTEEEIQSLALKYAGDVDGKEGIQFLGTVANVKGTWSQLKQIRSNTDVVQELQAQAVRGELDYDELSQALRGHLISAQDAQSIVSRDSTTKDHANRDFEKEVKLLSTSVKKGSMVYQSVGKQKADKINSGIMQVQDAVVRGDLTPEQGQAALRKIKDKTIPQMAYESQVQNKNKQLLVSGKHRISQNIPTYNRDKALKAITDMGIVRNSQGTRRQNLTIADPMTNDRNGNGIPNEKGDKHIGTDVGGVKIGDKIYPPMDGNVVMTGHESTMGYYAVIETKKGFFMVQHMQPNFLKKIGDKIGRNDAIGYVGNSGHVSASGKANGCLHVEFWNKDLNVITPYDFK